MDNKGEKLSTDAKLIVDDESATTISPDQAEHYTSNETEDPRTSFLRNQIMTTLIAPHGADLTKLAHEASSLGLGIDFDPTRIDTLTIKTGDETRGENFTLQNGRLVEIRSINGAMYDAKAVDWVDRYTIDYDSRAQEVRSVKRIGAYVTETGQIDSKITKYVVIEPISKQGQIRLHQLTEQFVPRQDNEPNSVQSIHTTPIPDGWKPRFDNQDGGTIEN